MGRARLISKTWKIGRSNSMDIFGGCQNVGGRKPDIVVCKVKTKTGRPALTWKSSYINIAKAEKGLQRQPKAMETENNKPYGATVVAEESSE